MFRNIFPSFQNTGGANLKTTAVIFCIFKFNFFFENFENIFLAKVDQKILVKWLDGSNKLERNYLVKEIKYFYQIYIIFFFL